MNCERKKWMIIRSFRPLNNPIYLFFCTFSSFVSLPSIALFFSLLLDIGYWLLCLILISSLLFWSSDYENVYNSQINLVLMSIQHFIVSFGEQTRHVKIKWTDFNSRSFVTPWIMQLSFFAVGPFFQEAKQDVRGMHC